MRFLASAFSVPKRGTAKFENQDAIRPPIIGMAGDGTGQIELDSFGKSFVCMGIADGASEGVMSGSWARLILHAMVKHVAGDSDTLNLDFTVSTAIRRWMRLKERKSQRGKRPLTSLPLWLEEDALARGAFATICVAKIQDGVWSCLAVGDSCMFQVRQDDLLASFPLERSEEFDNSPPLIGSDNELNSKLGEHVKHMDGQWQREDVFYFATDALACWILRRHESGDSPWRLLWDLDPRYSHFDEFVEKLRNNHEIRNDDTTLIRLQLQSS